MRPVDRVLCVAAIALVVGSAGLLGTDLPLADLAAGFGLVAVADLLRIEIAGKRASSLATAPALGIAIATGRPALAIVSFAGGVVVASAIRKARSVADWSRETIVAGAVAGAYGLAALVDPWILGSDGGDVRLAVTGFLAAVAIGLVADAGFRAVSDPHSDRLLTLLRALLPFHLATASAAGLFALSAPTIGRAAYPLFLAPLVATHHAFRQLHSVRKTFDQTIRALSTIPEVAGYSHAGHAERVATLSVGIGRELGLSDAALTDLAVAARLHDLGRMRAASPEAVSMHEPSELAHSGAAVVRTTGALPNVALIIESQHLPYRDASGRQVADVPIGARIVRVASIYDDLTGTGADAHLPEVALTIIGRHAGDRFDPAVVAALGRVVEATLSPASA